ncbi:MAG: efflux RND transporter permease subunit, partial [Opitutaceae bacterium]|nr:efflux RND transporter permease subunit [Verrucomicrobiales bacterium]
MQKLADLSIRRPIFASMIILALVVVGTSGYLKLNVDRSPAVDIPTVYVQASLPGASPVEMESLVAQRLEESINTVEGIADLRSVSSVGRTFVIIRFDLNREANRAVEDV